MTILELLKGKVVFKYPDPVSNHHKYCHCVDDHDHLPHSSPSFEETYQTHDWYNHVFAFLISMSEIKLTYNSGGISGSQMRSCIIMNSGESWNGNSSKMNTL